MGPRFFTTGMAFSMTPSGWDGLDSRPAELSTKVSSADPEENYKLLDDYVERDIRAVVDVAHENSAITKVIFENDFLPNDELKIRLCEICERVGAEFVKTSTGFGFVKQADGNYQYQGATEDDIALMRKHCGPSVRIKAAGGVRTHADALKMRELGATRIGASSSRSLIQEQESGDEGVKGY